MPNLIRTERVECRDCGWTSSCVQSDRDSLEAQASLHRCPPGGASWEVWERLSRQDRIDLLLHRIGHALDEASMDPEPDSWHGSAMKDLAALKRMVGSE